jgi:hypothetical protein
MLKNCARFSPARSPNLCSQQLALRPFRHQKLLLPAKLSAVFRLTGDSSPNANLPHSDGWPVGELLNFPLFQSSSALTPARYGTGFLKSNPIFFKSWTLAKAGFLKHWLVDKLSFEK